MPSTQQLEPLPGKLRRDHHPVPVFTRQGFNSWFMPLVGS